MRFAPALILIAAALALAAARPASERARMYDRWALEIVSRSDATVEEHQRAQNYIDEAISLEPDSASHWLLLGRLRDLEEEDMLARAAYRKAIALAPLEPEPRMRLGRSWKRAWLRTLNREARDQAIAQFDTVTRLRPYGSEAWLALVPLQYERGELGRAGLAAERALAGHPRRPEDELAAAYMGYRLGFIELADSLFRDAIPQLPPDLQALMDDPLRLLRSPVKSDSGAATADTLGPADSAGANRRPPPIPSAALPFSTPGVDPNTASLAELDPDPTTPQNEVQLEVWSRIAHAYLLLADPRRPGLDARAETYIRYGPPQLVLLNPAGTPLFFVPLPTLPDDRWEANPQFPLDAQRWDYPDLGMQVLLHDRSLVGRYTEAWTREALPGSTPDPGILAHRPDLIALGGGRGVITTLPPAGQRLDVRGGVSAFESESGPRVLVQARVPGAPDDTLVARWVARDALGRDVAHGEEVPSVSACDPAGLRLAEFTGGLRPGRYEIAVSVRDAHQRRGLFRTSVALPGGGPTVELSDLVLCCGDPSQLAEAGAVRIEADLDATVGGPRPLVVYFEIYHLAPGPEGASHFRYEYEVKRLASDRSPRAIRDAERRPPVDRWVSRDEENSGPTRRQFVRVQTSSLATGRYRVRVRVRDLVAGVEAEREVEFARE